MDDPTKTVMDELARTSGVVGVERLAALFTRREPEAAKTMSKAEVRKMANEVLRVKLEVRHVQPERPWHVQQRDGMPGWLW